MEAYKPLELDPAYHWRELDEHGLPMIECGDVISVGKRKFLRFVCKGQPCEHRKDWIIK